MIRDMTVLFKTWNKRHALKTTSKEINTGTYASITCSPARYMKLVTTTLKASTTRRIRNLEGTWRSGSTSMKEFRRRYGVNDRVALSLKNMRLRINEEHIP